MAELVEQERADLGKALVARGELAVSTATLADAEARLAETRRAHATLEAAHVDLGGVEARHAALMTLTQGDVVTAPLFAQAWVFGRRAKDQTKAKLVLISLGKLRPKALATIPQRDFTVSRFAIISELFLMRTAISRFHGSLQYLSYI
ncbi:MAG: hypothetical protein V3R25_06890 [Nitrosomonadaceae bacterium]